MVASTAVVGDAGAGAGVVATKGLLWAAEGEGEEEGLAFCLPALPALAAFFSFSCSARIACFSTYSLTMW